jgi:hypothetical protein
VAFAYSWASRWATASPWTEVDELSAKPSPPLGVVDMAARVEKKRRGWVAARVGEVLRG